MTRGHEKLLRCICHPDTLEVLLFFFLFFSPHITFLFVPLLEAIISYCPWMLKPQVQNVRCCRGDSGSSHRTTWRPRQVQPLWLAAPPHQRVPLFHVGSAVLCNLGDDIGCLSEENKYFQFLPVFACTTRERISETLCFVPKRQMCPFVSCL